jgi:hypothetical protein
MAPKKRGGLSARSRRGGVHQKAGTQNKEKAVARALAEDEGESRYLPLGMRAEDAPDPPPDPEEEAKRAIVRARACERKQREREREREAKEALRAQRAELAAMAEGAREDPLTPALEKSVLRRHQRTAAKVRALFAELAAAHCGAEALQRGI